MKKIFTIIMVQLFLVSAFAQEAERKGAWAVGGYVGPTLMMNDFSLLNGQGIDIGATGMKVFSDIFAVRADVGITQVTPTYIPHDGHMFKEYVGSKRTYLSRITDGGFNRQTLDRAGYHYKSIHTDIMGVFNLPIYSMLGKDYSKWSAYMMGGFGFSLYSVGDYSSPKSNGIDYLMDKESLDLGSLWRISFTPQFIFGAGTSYKVNDKWDAFGEAKATFTNNDNMDGLVYPSGTDYLVSIRVGARYRFHKNDDNPIDWFENHKAKAYKQTTDNTKRIDAVYADDDGDGVPNYIDKDPNTPNGAIVDGSGKALDLDKDGVPDYKDEELFSMGGSKVDDKGNAIDSDGDGVPDHLDKEPNTPAGTLVNFQGISIASVTGGGEIPTVFFDFNSSRVKPEYVGSLAGVLSALNDDASAKVLIVGHTDYVGSEKFNQTLGMKRAEAVKSALVSAGVDASRIMTDSKGKSSLLAQTQKQTSGMINRRVEIKIIK